MRRRTLPVLSVRDVLAGLGVAGAAGQPRDAPPSSGTTASRGGSPTRDDGRSVRSSSACRASPRPAPPPHSNSQTERQRRRRRDGEHRPKHADRRRAPTAKPTTVSADAVLVQHQPRHRDRRRSRPAAPSIAHAPSRRQRRRRSAAPARHRSRCSSRCGRSG